MQELGNELQEARDKFTGKEEELISVKQEAKVRGDQVQELQHRMQKLEGQQEESHILLQEANNRRKS